MPSTVLRIERASNDYSLWAVALATLVKDIRLEWRSKDALNSMLFFSLLVVVIFCFFFLIPLPKNHAILSGGPVWIAFLFAAVVALNQTWARELRNQVLDAYRSLRPQLPRYF